MGISGQMLNNLASLLYIGVLGTGELILILLFTAVPAVLWLIALIDLLRSTFKDSTNKLIWALVIIFIPVLGAILYLLIGKNQKLRTT